MFRASGAAPGRRAASAGVVPLWAGYAISLALCALVLTVHVTIGRDLVAQFPFLLAYSAVMFSAVVGGFGPGLLATVVLGCAVASAIPPAGIMAIDNPMASLALAIFLITGLLASWASGRVRQATAALAEAHQRLQDESEERERVQQALLAAEARFRAAQDVSLQPFTILRAVRANGAIVDFEWTYANDAAARALKTGREQLVGARLLERLPGNRETLFPKYCRVVETGEGHDVELRYESDGITGWFRNVASKLGDGVAVAFTDVTESHRQQELLEERDRMKNRFLAVLAHELRQPLNAVVMGAHALEQPALAAGRTPEIAALLQRQVKQLTRLVDDLNDLTRINSGRLDVERRRFDLRDCLSAAVETWRGTFEHDGRELTLLVPEYALTIDGDASRIRQVFSNLISNAERATREGGQVSVVAVDGQESGSVVVRVRDTGQGIAPELLPEIFNLFAADGSDSAQLGVGLALVKRLVELHGGEATVTSGGPGRGAEFTVRLPRARE